MIPVNPEDYVCWETGYGSVQELMPYLTQEHQEFILSGITKEEWVKVFKENDLFV